MSTRCLPRHIRRMAELAYCSLNSPRSLTAYLLLRHGEWDQLSELQADPSDYLDTVSGVERYRRDAQASDLLRKYNDLPTSFDKKERAIALFHESEERCLLTNIRLDLLRSSPLGEYDRACARILALARKWISDLIGTSPPEAITSHCRFGPGTAFELKGRGSTLADKFWNTPHVTPDCQMVFDHFWSPTILARERTALGLPWSFPAEGNRFTTVPKDSKVDRGICIEPLGNLFCQLGIGGFLKGRLASTGIFVGGTSAPSDPLEALRTRRRLDGQELHRRLARVASVDGSMSTIDLSSASDCIAKNLVRDLLPPDWYALLDSTRSKRTLLLGSWHLLEKFSSMGNGFTFELETLIFCGLIHGVTRLTPGTDFFVYGDDIIVPTEATRDSLAVLRAFGFVPNPKKTFTSGLFRESCGGDFFCGTDVRSYFFKSEPTFPCEWFTVYNSLRRRGIHLPLKTILDNIPLKERRFGPEQLGDLVLHSSSRDLWRVLHQGGISWVLGRELVPFVYSLDRWSDELHLSLATYGVSSSGVSPQGMISGVRTVRLSVS